MGKQRLSENQLLFLQALAASPGERLAISTRKLAEAMNTQQSSVFIFQRSLLERGQVSKKMASPIKQSRDNKTVWYLEPAGKEVLRSHYEMQNKIMEMSD